jgi:hypothetical protein
MASLPTNSPALARTLQKPAEDGVVTVLTPQICHAAVKTSSRSMTPDQPFIVTRRVAQQ